VNCNVVFIGEGSLAGLRSSWIGGMGVTVSMLFCVFAIAVLYRAVGLEEKRQQHTTQSNQARHRYRSDSPSASEKLWV